MLVLTGILKSRVIYFKMVQILQREIRVEIMGFTTQWLMGFMTFWTYLENQD